MDLIAAISTGTNPTAIGIVRVSGEGCLALCNKVFRPVDANRPLPSLKGYTAAYGHVYDSEGDMDDCVALVFRAPKSYTGEDVVELSCHGGALLTEQVLSAVLSAGARPAAPGEFTRRAVMNGKMKLSGAEALGALLEAKTTGQLALSRGGLRGKLSAAHGKISQALIYLTADMPVAYGVELVLQ